MKRSNENITQSEFEQVNKILEEVNAHLQTMKLESKIYNKYSLETNGDTIIVSLNKESLNKPLSSVKTASKSEEGKEV